MNLGKACAGILLLSLVEMAWAGDDGSGKEHKTPAAHQEATAPDVSPDPEPSQQSPHSSHKPNKPQPSQPGTTVRLPDDLPVPSHSHKVEIWGQVENHSSSCHPAVTEAPCAALGVASMPSRKSINVAVGNPVNPQTGQKFQMDLDAEALDGPLGLEIRRYYNSALASVSSSLGRAWLFSYDTRLFVTPHAFQIIQADGGRHIFPRSAPVAQAGSGVSAELPHCTGLSADEGSVSARADGGYQWQWPNGRVLYFNGAGWLTAIRPATDPAAEEGSVGAKSPSGAHAFLQISRLPDGRIQSVTDPAGHVMRFRYDPSGHLSAIEHPAGTWQYRAATLGQLLSVRAPGGNRRLYRYDDIRFPYALTAIAVESPALKAPVVISQWHYDAKGRVSRYQGWRGEDMRFSYAGADRSGVLQTEVRDAAGGRQTYRYRSNLGVWQTLSITGQRCEHCRLADRDYQYDKQGQLIGMHQRMDAPAQSFHRAFRFERDAQGRILAVYVRVWRVPGQGPARDMEAGQPWQLYRRYFYATGAQRYPSRIEQPSVEKGRMYTVAFEYRMIAGKERPVQLTESGYSGGRLVSRHVSVNYDGAGQLLSFDGPLPGAEDTVQVRRDVRRADGAPEWRLIDSLGREVSRSTDHWAGSSMAWLDDIGHFHVEAGAVHHLADNGVKQTVFLDDFNRVVRMVSPDSGVDTIDYDEADRVVQETDATGAKVRFTHDAWNRPLTKTVTAPDGFREQTRYRYAGIHLVEVQGEVSTERYQYDDMGRLVMRTALIHPAGATVSGRFVYQYHYVGSARQPARVTLPDGSVVRRQARPASDGHSPAVEVTLAPAPGGPSSRNQLLYRREYLSGAADGGVKDDWSLGDGGQRQLSWSAQHRLTDFRETAQDAAAKVHPLYALHYRYLPDGRLQRVDSLSQTQQFMYDAAGHLIIAQTRTNSRVAPERLQQPEGAWWYAYDDNGNRLYGGHHPLTIEEDGAGTAVEPRASGNVAGSGRQASYVSGTNRVAGVAYDAAGRPLQWQGWQLGWHPGGQIQYMTHVDGRQIRYFYNHRGERVARQQGKEWQFFDYTDGRLQAQTVAGQDGMRLWWYEGEIPVVIMARGALRYGSVAADDAALQIHWLHVDHRGLPVMRTDARGRIVWQQAYGPFGEQGGLLPGDPVLRLPGQWCDPETGLYYNQQRDYDPVTGRYLSPDPLGLRAGSNPYLYVDAEPLRYVDPTGLMLFAFDGTHNAPDRPTNIWHFYRAYDGQANGPGGDLLRPYLEGVGVSEGPHAAYGRTDGKVDRGNLEALTADQWKDNVNYQVDRFMMAVQGLGKGETLNIDVVGFSRGAAQALEFGRVIARKLASGEIAHPEQVRLRFMGLLDPVFTNMYDDVAQWETECHPMEVDQRWEHVINILAAHDTRGNLFNAGSLGQQVNTHPGRGSQGAGGGGGPAGTEGDGRSQGIREEIMLAGGHSDIGGGYLGPYSAQPDGDLSDIALWVLMERAERAGVKLGAVPWELTHVDLPVVHGTGSLVEGSGGRFILQDGRFVPDWRTHIDGVHPYNRWFDEANRKLSWADPYLVWFPAQSPEQNIVHPELAEIGLRVSAVPADAEIMTLSGRRPEALMGDGPGDRPIDMKTYCAFLKDRRILTGEKYLGYCR